MRKNKMKWYLVFMLMLLLGYMTRELISNEEVECPRCHNKVVPMSLYERFTVTCYDSKCDSCGFLFALQSDSIIGIHYWSLNKDELRNDYIHFQE